jgi:hypothetical protein
MNVSRQKSYNDVYEAGEGPGILRTFVRQTKSLLCNVHAQHAFQAYRRAPASVAFWVVRHDRRPQ